MQQSMYSALFGALSNETRLNVSANNLANVNTTGYKRDRQGFMDVFNRYVTDNNFDPRGSLREPQLFPDAQIMAKPRLAGNKVDFSQGNLAATNNPFDMAISGPGFFKVQAPGGEMLTRNGEFHLSPQGMLVTAQGYPVLGTSGPIVLPPGKNVLIDAQGQILVDGQATNQIGIFKVGNEQDLQKVGANTFTGKPGRDAAQTPADWTETRLVQGHLEKPNVEVVEEMVNMIETHRSFEAYQKIMTSSSEMDDKAINRVGETRM